MEFSAKQLAELHRKLAEYFSDEELQTLCFDLGIDYADMPADGKAFKARDLVGFMQRRGRIPELIAVASRQRPNVSWTVGPDGNDIAVAPGSSVRQTALQEYTGWDRLPSDQVGDVIIAQVGAGAKNVAVGKGITQTNVDASGSDDRLTIERGLSEVATALDRVRGHVDASTTAVADFQMKLLGSELGKTRDGEVPSATTILQVGDWLLEHLPECKPALKSLFTTPAVSRVMAKAGDAAIVWVKTRFS